MDKDSPWRVLRPFSRFTDYQNLERIQGRAITIFLLLPEWVGVMNPGDPIELVDRDDLQRWVLGKVTFAKKVVMKSALPSDVHQSLVAQLHPEKKPEEVTADDICAELSAYYDESVTLDSSIAIIGIQVEETSVPQYTLRFEEDDEDE